jgi:fumarylacetoacetate (FAA) hydrolase
LKLGSLNNGRDGELVVVDNNLRRCIRVMDIAPTLQHALDHWERCEAPLSQASAALNSGERSAKSLEFDPAAMAAPLPRAYQWLDGSVYLNHAELLRRMRNSSLPETAHQAPMMYQGASDSFLGPTGDLVADSEDWGIDLEAEIAVITDDVPQGVSVDDAASHIKLMVLLNDASFRNIIIEEVKTGLGFIQGKPATAFSPVAATPDEFGAAWDGRKLHLPVFSYVNDVLLGWPNAGVDMYFDFAQLIAHAARTRELAAGTVIGAGTISNHDRSVGSSCIAERRMIQSLEEGGPPRPYLKFGDRVRIEIRDATGASPLGAIEQTVVRRPTGG